MKRPRIRIGTIAGAAALVILLAALPSAVRDTVDTGRVYLFSRQFIDEIPQRLAGPGRFRFVLQPVIAIVLGWRAGLGDARAGRPAYLWGLIFGGTDRMQRLRSGLADIRNLVAMGIVLDAVAQLLIYRQVHPGAALVVGPVLIGVPYALARALTCRGAQLKQHLSAK